MSINFLYKKYLGHRMTSSHPMIFNFSKKDFSQKIKKKNFFCFLFLLSTFFLNAQLTTSEILATAKDQYLIQLQRQRVDFLKENSSKLPVMDELEFRTETNDFRLREQRYTLRGRFFTKDQRNAQQGFQQANIELKSIEEQILMNEFLKERYLGIMEAYFFDQLLEAEKEKKILQEDRVTVLRKSINLPKFEILDLLDAEDNLQTAERDILRLENAVLTSEMKIFRWTNETGFLKKGDIQLIPVEQVMEQVRSLPTEPSTAHATLVKRNLNQTVALQEQAIRRASEENTFEYFQARIGGTDDDGFRQNFKLGVGIRIPVRNREQLDLEELEYDKIDEGIKYKELQVALKSRMAQIVIEMENQYRLYELLQQQIQNNQADNVFKQYQKIAGTSPMALLKLKGNRFKKELERLSVEQNIYQLYIELLDASGKMMEMPLRNYLMEDQPIF